MVTASTDRMRAIFAFGECWHRDDPLSMRGSGIGGIGFFELSITSRSSPGAFGCRSSQTRSPSRYRLFYCGCFADLILMAFVLMPPWSLLPIFVMAIIIICVLFQILLQLVQLLQR